MKTIKTIIHSTGIGVLLLLFGFTVKTFTESEEGINFIKKEE